MPRFFEKFISIYTFQLLLFDLKILEKGLIHTKRGKILLNDICDVVYSIQYTTTKKP